MHQAASFWNEYKTASGSTDKDYKEAFQFGDKADWLASLVVEGKKQATCSAYAQYALDDEALPEPGEYSIVLDGSDAPVAVIKTLTVDIVPMNEVTEDFALAEGEGDYEAWWKAHEVFFTNLMKSYNQSFSPDMLLVCERFKKVYPE